MAKKLIIMMVNPEPRNGEELGVPCFQETVAATMDCEVEVVCTSTTGQLMKTGVAEQLVVKPESSKTVYDFTNDAHEAGVKFYCCSPQSRSLRHDRRRPDPRMQGHRRRRAHVIEGWCCPTDDYEPRFTP